MLPCVTLVRILNFATILSEFCVNKCNVNIGPQVKEAREPIPEEPLEVLALGGSVDLVLEADEAQRIQQVSIADFLLNYWRNSMLICHVS